MAPHRRTRRRTLRAALTVLLLTTTTALAGAATSAPTARAADAEATFDDYVSILCPVAIARGLVTVDLPDGATPPTNVNQSWPEGTEGEWTHLGEPAPCLSAFLPTLREPQRSNYTKTLQAITNGLAACAGSGFKNDQNYRNPGFNPAYDYRNYVSATNSGQQGGDTWGGCLSRPPLSDRPSPAAIAAGADRMAPAPGSLTNSLFFCRDDRATPGPDYLGCRTSFRDKYIDSRRRERASQSDMTLFNNLRDISKSINQSLGVTIDSGGYGTIPGSPNASLEATGQIAATPLTVGDLQAAVG